MQIRKGTKCFTSEYGHYNIVYMTDNISEFNTDCTVETKPYVNPKNKDFIAVLTSSRYIGTHEYDGANSIPIIVWISSN